MSFYPLKDSFGTTQLIVNHSENIATDLSVLAKIPVESAVLIEGTVLLRPPNARRPVSQSPSLERSTRQVVVLT
jgi:aspartyl-tRNA synthetase